MSDNNVQGLMWNIDNCLREIIKSVIQVSDGESIPDFNINDAAICILGNICITSGGKLNYDDSYNYIGVVQSNIGREMHEEIVTPIMYHYPNLILMELRLVNVVGGLGYFQIVHLDLE